MINEENYLKELLALFNQLQAFTPRNSKCDESFRLTLYSTEWHLQTAASDGSGSENLVHILVGKQKFGYEKCDRCRNALEVTTSGETVEVDDEFVLTTAAHSHKLVANLCYHPIWQAPVLYFNLYHTDDSIFSFDEVQLYLRLAGPTDITSSTLDKLTVISQCEHPFFRAPTYYVHPCNTHKLLSTMQSLRSGSDCSDSGSSSKRNSGLLLFWFSVVSQLIGLHVDVAVTSSAS